MNTSNYNDTGSHGPHGDSRSAGDIFRSAALVSRDSSRDVTETPATTPEIRNDPYGCDTPGGLDIRASSSMDCTGLIPALPESEAELESYAELYHYPADIFNG